MLQKNLGDITSSFAKGIVTPMFKLSPREIEVCNLVRNGLTSKEIASMLRVSPLTVERHRYNIRRKLGIVNAKVNLTTFLVDL